MSEMNAAHYASSDATSGLKQKLVANMKDGKSHMFRLFKEVVESKSYVKLAKEKIMFLPVASESSSLAMAGAELGIHDLLSNSAECDLKRKLQHKMNLLLDPRDAFRTHETVKGLKQGDNRRGVTFYHTDISEGMEIEPIQGSLRDMPREEQEGILRRHWGEHTFTQWQKTAQYQDWAKKFSSSDNQPDVKSTRRTKSMSNAYSSDESEVESSDEESSGTKKPSSSLSRGGHRSFNNKSMSNAYSSESDEESSGEESSGTKKPSSSLSRGGHRSFNNKSMSNAYSSDESDEESSDEESSGTKKPSSSLSRGGHRSFNNKSMSNAYSSDESDEESSDEESSGTKKPSSSLSRGGHRSFNNKSMSNAYSSDESEDESSSSGEESSGTKPSFVKKTLPHGKRFRLESDDESSSSDEESSGMGLPSSKKRAASPYKTSEDEGKWSCKHCTYENDPSVKICAMCDQ